MKKFLSALAAVIFAAASSSAHPGVNDGGQAGSQELSIAAASDMQHVLPEIDKAFEKANPGVKVKATFGSSGNFYTQLTNKAPFDVFLSADDSYPSKLVEQGLACKEPFLKYAVGRIVLWAPADSKLDVAGQGAKALLDPTVVKISIANPKHAPYGRAAEAAMKSLGVYDEVKSKLVLGENITQAAQYVESRSADVGVIAKSLTYSQSMAGGKTWEFPLDSYPTMVQAGVAMSWAKSPALAKSYLGFLASDEGKAILKSYGFTMPEAKDGK